MVASILLQVGYATTAGQNTHIVNTEVFKVQFEDNPSIKYDSYMDVTAKVGKGIVSIDVSNLYPGGKFEVIPIIKNSGELDATITQVQFVETQGEGYSEELFEALVGYSKGETVADYSAYLSNTYLGQVIEVDTTLAIPLELGLDPKETGLQNERIQFSLILQFAQKETGEGGGGNGNGNEGSGEESNESTREEASDKDINKDINKEINKDTSSPEEQTSVGEIVTQKERTKAIEKQGPEASVLPKTGGVAPILVYGLGIVLLGSGIITYRKKDE